MDKRLLAQVQKALQAQQDTIVRQEQMLNRKDEDIVQLTALLTRLAKTQSEELQALPSRFEGLSIITKQFTAELTEYNQQRREWMSLQERSVKELVILSNSQVKLAELMSSYQRTIAPPNESNSAMNELAKILKDVKESQNIMKIMQAEISSSQDIMDERQQVLTQELRAFEQLSK